MSHRTTFTQRRERFRALLHTDQCHPAASVFDPISARIAEDAGFALGILAGSVASLAVLGAPDLSVLTLSELADQAARITRGSSMPLLVDADHGFGNALNVIRTVEELELSGVAALTIEDTDLPRAFGAGDNFRLLSLSEGIGKMKAGLAARRDPSLVVIGRTGAASISGLDDAIARSQAYAAAGVDAIYLTGIKDSNEFRAVADAVGIPVMMASTDPEPMDLHALATCGVSVAVLGHAPILAAVRAVHEAMAVLRAGGTQADIATPSPELMRQLTRGERYDRWIEAFLT